MILQTVYRDHRVLLERVGRWSWTGSVTPPEGIGSDFLGDPFRSLSALRTLRKLTRYIDAEIAFEDMRFARDLELGDHSMPRIHRVQT